MKVQAPRRRQQREQPVGLYKPAKVRYRDRWWVRVSARKLPDRRGYHVRPCILFPSGATVAPCDGFLLGEIVGMFAGRLVPGSY